MQSCGCYVAVTIDSAKDRAFGDVGGGEMLLHLPKYLLYP